MHFLLHIPTQCIWQWTLTSKKKTLWSKLLAARLFLDPIVLTKWWLLGIQLVQNINLIIGPFTSHMSIPIFVQRFWIQINKTQPGLRALHTVSPEMVFWLPEEDGIFDEIHGIPQNFTEFHKISWNFRIQNSVQYFWSWQVFLLVTLTAYAVLAWLLDTCWSAERACTVFIYLQINLKADIFGSCYEWRHVVSPTGDNKLHPHPPCSTDLRRIFVRPLGQPLWPQGWLAAYTIRKRRETWKHLDVYGKQELVLVWTCLYHRGLSCTSTYLHNRGQSCTCLDKRILCWFGHVDTIGASTAPKHVSTAESFTAPGHVNKTGAWAAPERVSKTGAWATPGHVWTTGASVYTIGARAAPGRVYTSEAFSALGRVFATGAWAAPGFFWP